MGSSASTSFGSVESARAIITRWRSPIESCSGRWPRRPPSPRRSSSGSTVRSAVARAGQPQLHRGVLDHRPAREQVEGLIDVSQLAQPVARAHRPRRAPRYPARPRAPRRCPAQQRRDQHQQRRLARAAGPVQRHQLARGDRARHAVDGAHRLAVADLVVLRRARAAPARRSPTTCRVRITASRAASPGKSITFAGLEAGLGAPAARRRASVATRRDQPVASASETLISTAIPVRPPASRAARVISSASAIPSHIVRSSTSSSRGSRAIPWAIATSARSQSAGPPSAARRIRSRPPARALPREERTSRLPCAAIAAARRRRASARRSPGRRPAQPICSRSRRECERSERPARSTRPSSTRPSSGGSIPAASRSSVVFPWLRIATTETTSPARTWRLTRRSSQRVSSPRRDRLPTPSSESAALISARSPPRRAPRSRVGEVRRRGDRAPPRRLRSASLPGARADAPGA